MFAARELAKLGYEFREGGGSRSDWVLRQTADSQKGFEWKDQGHYDQLGDAVVSYVQLQLTGLCGLMPLPLPPVPTEANSVVYASSNFKDHPGPLLLLVCGSAPGGAAGIWGRSLCINKSLEEGAMFDYIFRAEALGWSVVVANPNVNEVNYVPVAGSECPQQHLLTLWKSYIEPSAASRVLVVAHSYGAPNVVHLLKAEASFRERLAAVAFTDGGSFPPGSLLQEVVPSDQDVTKAHESGKGTQMEALQRQLASFRLLTPLAFEPASEEVRSCLAEVGRNFLASQQPPGTPLKADHDGVPAVSAGHESHPATTHACREEVFAFLQQGSAGQASLSNNELRATLL